VLGVNVEDVGGWRGRLRAHSHDVGHSVWDIISVANRSVLCRAGQPPLTSMCQNVSGLDEVVFSVVTLDHGMDKLTWWPADQDSRLKRCCVPYPLVGVHWLSFWACCVS